MSIKKELRENIVSKIIESIGMDSEHFSASKIAECENTSVQTIYRYLKSLEEQGIVEKHKEGKQNRFVLKQEETFKEFCISEISEDLVWSKFAAPFFEDLPQTAKKNLGYAFTEILNNAIEHSDGKKVGVLLTKNHYLAQVCIKDDGIGIFNKISETMGLSEKSYAILELAKGKFTTAPDSHTGEGIFFSSKVVDEFAIVSGDLIFLGAGRDNRPYLDSKQSSIDGTTVIMAIKYNHSETAGEVFDRFTQDPDDYGFSKTIVPIRLLEYGDENPLVVSRSQARRLTTRFERFENVILDFSGVDEIGQGFADELFRVFKKQHPNTILCPINCSESVKKMIKRVSDF